MITKAGIYRDFPEADYFADPCPAPSLSQSLVKVLVEQSELHAREEHPKLKSPATDDDEPEKYVKAQAIGNAAHALLIGRGKTLAVGHFDDWRKKEAATFRLDALSAGKVPILAEHMATANVMVIAARTQLLSIGDPCLLDAFCNGDGEVVVAAEIDGIWMRSLIDWMVNPRMMFDYKTTGASVAPHVIPNKMADDGWPIQAAMQERILDVIDPAGAGRRRFIFVAQENYKPFALTVHELSEGVMTMGRKMLAKGESMWRDAITADKWPGYVPMIHTPEYPGFKETQWLNREVAHESRRPSIDPKILLAGSYG